MNPTQLLEQRLCEIRDKLDLFSTEFINIDGSTRPVSIKGSEEAVLLTDVNDKRTELWLHNSSAHVLYIGLTDDIKTDKYALRVASFDTLILNANTYKSLYKKKVYGFWANGASSTSKCMVTEFFEVL